jgi:phosphatidylinositol-3-phosphatase
VFVHKKSTLQNFRYACGVLLLGAVVSAFLIQTTTLTVSAGTSDRSTLKNYQHVFIVMMENTGFDTLIGNSNAPFINFAASSFGLATNYTGVTHPSQPNYIVATSGSTPATVNVQPMADLVGAKK